ncbi:MAG: hypothetical protein HOY71_50005 [Nonomuraea sp.]|nr:hypothetical protein [Nonomuraea sp.]
MRRLLIAGLVLGVLLAVLDLAGLAGLFVEPAPPPALVIASAVLGLATLVAVPAAWRANRTGVLTVVVTRILSALLSIPAFFAPEAPNWARIVSALAIAATVVAVALIVPGSRNKSPIG